MVLLICASFIMFSSTAPIAFPKATYSVLENSTLSAPGVQSIPETAYPSYNSRFPEIRYKSSFGFTVTVFLDTTPSLFFISISSFALNPFSFDTDTSLIYGLLKSFATVFDDTQICFTSPI